LYFFSTEASQGIM